VIIREASRVAKESGPGIKDFVKTRLPSEATDQNIAVVRSLIDAWNRREAGIDAYHEDAEWDFTRSRFGEIRHSWKGVDGMREVFATVLTAWSELRVEAERIIQVGAEVVVIARHYGRRPSTGLEISDGGAYVIAMDDGKVAKFTFYPDKEEALESVGLGTTRDSVARGAGAGGSQDFRRSRSRGSGDET
jgi:ketosteroid isomerase-like protein